MFRLVNIVRCMGGDAIRPHILFATLDPGCDTPQVLHRYVTAFDAGHAVGLSGMSSITDQQIGGWFSGLKGQ
jgi:protein SCO1/2